MAEEEWEKDFDIRFCAFFIFAGVIIAWTGDSWLWTSRKDKIIACQQQQNEYAVSEFVEMNIDGRKAQITAIDYNLGDCAIQGLKVRLGIQQIDLEGVAWGTVRPEAYPEIWVKPFEIRKRTSP